MVNPYDDSRLMLALQIDHSRVAGFFAAHWGNQDFAKPEPYASVVLAAHEHDIGWWEWEMKPSTLNDKGFPMDYHDGSFKYLGQLRLDFYKNAVDRVLKRDPYAALLMAMHGVALMNAGYGKYAYPPDRTGRSPGESLRRGSGTIAGEVGGGAATIGVQGVCVGGADMDQLRIHGGIRPAGAVCLQSLSAQQQMAQAGTDGYAERRGRADEGRE